MSIQDERRDRVRKIRIDAAEAAYGAPLPPQPNNGDEELYADQLYIGSATKGLRHNAAGEVDPAAYRAYLAAIRAGTLESFEALVRNGYFGVPDAQQAQRRRFVNPLSGFAFDLEGIDPGQLAMRPAPAFASAEEAGEMVELYWMALLRDVPFADYPTNATAIAAAADLSKLSDFRGPKTAAGVVTPDLLFRDSYPGCETGPYASQFMLQPVAFGSQAIDTKITNLDAVPTDYNTVFADWLNTINGLQPAHGAPSGPAVYCYDGRALSQYVHVDVLFQAYFVACVNLLANKYSASDANPYGRAIDNGTGLPLPAGAWGTLSQVGFGTFGAPSVATLVCEAATRALKHMWYQKWQIHRRLRPEEFGGRVEALRLAINTVAYPFHHDLMASAVLPRILAAHGSHLLPLAFPEGSPVHTAYGSGHATVAGACVTILKAFFDGAAPIIAPLMPQTGNPAALVPYTGGTLTVEGELNKLASNISQGRNIAGVHWRTDATEANKLGEEVAIGMLRELRPLYREPFDGFTFRRFDGTSITV